MLVDLGDGDVAALDSVARRSNTSRAALIRAAVAEWLNEHKRAGQVEAFGLWAGRAGDGLDYQERVRREW